VYEVWQIIVALAIVINCLLASLMMSFISVLDSPWRISYVCDILTILNIVLSFFAVFVDRRGEAHAEFKIIAKKYLSGMFVIDVLSVLPLDYLLMGYMEHDSWTLATLRSNRMIGLIRVTKFLSESSLCLCTIYRLAQ